MASAPLLLDRLADDDHEHFEAVKELLDAAGVAYEVDPTLVRGLDYYTRTRVRVPPPTRSGRAVRASAAAAATTG